jgi:hypothetical protein
VLNEVIALVLAFAAEFVFYSVRHVELAFEILILQQQVAVQAKAAQTVGVVVRPTILDCPSDECGRDGKTACYA